ncbi:TetR/AcrR family transcriptional regulator [Aquipuribacter sp. SD81]|uniref:TetR/AcrR family transcriptional regulator n=1 Tax=Aquipuribacter sp. SD81 TaxID=3127703 RepID=UPI003015FAF1
MTPGPARRTRNARGEGARLRTELLAAASRLLAGGDPAAVTLRAVAREAGVAAPSVYGHFPDLDALLLAVVEQHLAELRAAFDAAVAGPGHAEERLRAGALEYCEWGLRHPGAYAVVFGGRAVRLLTEAEAVAFEDGEAMLDSLGALVARLPGVAAADVAGLRLAAWTGVHGVVSLRSGKPGYPWPPLADHVTAVLTGVLPRGGG